MDVRDEDIPATIAEPTPKRGRRPVRRRSPAEIDEAGETAEPGDALDLSGLTGVIGYTLRRAQLTVFEDFDRRFREFDLKPAQYSVLLVIGDNPGRKQSEIASALGIQRPNFVAMLDELERRGLAERTRSATDRRSHAVVLTAHGRRVLARARAVQARQEVELGELLGPGGREALVSLLKRLAAID